MLTFPLRGTVFSRIEPYMLSFDLGGSHICAAVATCRPLRVQKALSLPIQGILTAEAFMDALADMVVDVSAAFDPLPGASCAIGAPFDYKNGISHMHRKLTFFCGFDIKLDLRTRFGWKSDQVIFLNDGDAFLLGEIGCGATQHAVRMVGITLGTGIGSAFAIEGKIMTDCLGVPLDGEIWNLPYADGIVEDLLSTRALQKAYRDKTGLQREVVEIAAAAAEGSVAREVFEEFGTRLGSILGSILADFRPDVIVLGGGIARASHLFLPAAVKALHRLRSELRVSLLLDHAIVAGAAAYAFEQRLNSSS
jgi:glucokinase